MKPKILLVNPAVFDFAAYDFWLRPYGLLSVAGQLRGRADFLLFDYLDRLHPFYAGREKLRSDRWGRGRFHSEIIPNPQPLKDIARHYRRFGLPRGLFQEFLRANRPADFVLVQTVMTYWYPGVVEVIEDIRSAWPGAKIILGGNYITVCPSHAEKLDADLLVSGISLEPLWDFIGLAGEPNQPGLWEIYPELRTGALKLTEGCPFNCSYCSVPKVYGKFRPRPLERSLAELELLIKQGAADIAFYDDALLCEPDSVFVPFLNEVVKRNIKVNFHSPNALNARLLTARLAKLMLRSGFKTFYLGFESASEKWQTRTGSKVTSAELAAAVGHLKSAGVEPDRITAYQMLGHPDNDIQQLEESMRFVNSLGIRGMLADFSPIPGTPDGARCGRWVDMAEPLLHNKTAFPIIALGFDETNRLKDLQQRLNRNPASPR